MLVGDVIDTTLANLDLINALTPLDVQKHDKNVVEYSSELGERNKQLKQFLYHNMYYHWRVTRMKHRAEHFVENLFESYIAEPRQLPNEYQDQIEKLGKYRVVADYIAGMTDRGAVQEYRRLFDPMTRP